MAGGEFEEICPGIFLVGGPDLSDGRDCLVYALDLGEPVLIDCGAGPGWPAIRRNLAAAGIPPERLHTLVLTHAHVDHIGAAGLVKAESNCRLVAHILDAEAIGSGDPLRTAANWYGLTLHPLHLDITLEGDGGALEFSAGNLHLVHTPGHTPGSMAVWLDHQGQRLLFGQDIHGPFEPSFGSSLPHWRESMQRLLSLDADVLCEGHHGIFHPASQVRAFIQRHLAAHPG